MATYYGVNAGGNFSAGATWSVVATKGVERVAGATQPTNADTCILDNYSGSVTVDTTTCTCKILNCVTNGDYAGTLTFTEGQTLSIATAGSVVFASTMTLSGTGTLSCIGTNSLTSAGLTFPGTLSLITSGTKTLTDNWSISGDLQAPSGNSTLATSDITVAGSLIVTGGIAGSRTITMTGTGTTPTWRGGLIFCNLNFNAPAGAITISDSVAFHSATLTYTAGTMTTTGSTIISVASATFNLGAMHLNNLTLAAGSDTTYTLGSALILDGALTVRVPGIITIAGAYDISCANLYGNSTTANGGLKLLHGQTVTVTDSMMLAGAGSYTYTVQSDTAAKAYITYNGTQANCKVFNTIFTWISAENGSTPIWNWMGGTLSNTTNIYNKTSSDIGGSGGGVGIIG